MVLPILGVRRFCLFLDRTEEKEMGSGLNIRQIRVVTRAKPSVRVKRKSGEYN
jgi:hypothetical protein